ncbi:MAG TPA: VIT1/CCC1 transporter family protein [Candidatus Paceibacterota bacterium]|nr:VIT1/CCC1 transporter family protein [Candidatus Paceibacterota bacterium]
MQDARQGSLYVRNIIFGIEDSLAATVGLLSGIAAEQVPHETILLTGFVYIFVEAFSMGIGSFLSEESAQEYEKKRTMTSKRAALGGLVMFLSCIVGGLVPILPYLLLPPEYTLAGSITLSLIALSILGLVHARVSKRRAWPRVVRMVALGGTAILVGVAVGKLFGIA